MSKGYGMLIDHEKIERLRKMKKTVDEYFDFIIKDYKTGRYISFNIEDINKVEYIEDLVKELSINN